MLNTLIKRMFGSKNDRTLRRMQTAVADINAFEPALKALSDEQLAAKTPQFRERLAAGIAIDDILPEAFAVVREVSSRTIGLRHFDVQMIGGMVLHEGNIAEMRTGEGKTLVATLPAYLNALTGKGVHIVTVNDYLARRDSQWMEPIFSFLGMSIGVIFPDMPHADKQAAYQADILYGTNNEFGFDYLRDNMAFSMEEKVQRALNMAIVDEVDSILIDEARTPLIISGSAEDSSVLYQKVNALIPALKKQISEEEGGDFVLDEKQKQAHLTETGHEHIEGLLVKAKLLDDGDSLYHASNIMLMHHVNAALRAHAIFQRDVDYIVQNDQVVIVDEHTGRTMPGRRWSDGLHQAIEAKERVSIQNENQTLASITFQNFFRLYDKLSGMTGTADTEAYEFQQIYNLDVVVMPTNKPMRRLDEADLVYLTQADKFQAIIQDVKACIKRGQPVLVGTASIEASEHLSQLLEQEKVPHQVLNAKFHEKEAHVIAEAGRPGVVTIATNMAGRGTDIVLGGSQADDTDDADEWQKRHDAVIAAGGLRIIGSERHESRRIDNQLRGRSGRQGDVGSSRFYLSLEDNLMRIFASDRVAAIMRRLGMQSGEPIEHSLVTRAIENAQRKLEGHNFDVRKQLLGYDNVANEQRKVIYTQRNTVLEMHDPLTSIKEMRHEVIAGLVDKYIPEQSLEEQWDLETLPQVLRQDFKLECPIQEWVNKDNTLQPENIKDRVVEHFDVQCQAKESSLAKDVWGQFQKSIILQTLDNAWREHLATMEHLRQGIHLRGYAQKDPKQEYKREAFNLFSEMLDNIKYEIINLLATVEINTEEDLNSVEDQRRASYVQPTQFIHDQTPTEEQMTQDAAVLSENVTYIRHDKKVGRNDVCPCGSMKKYKHCHGLLG